MSSRKSSSETSKNSRKIRRRIEKPVLTSIKSTDSNTNINTNTKLNSNSLKNDGKALRKHKLEKLQKGHNKANDSLEGNSTNKFVYNNYSTNNKIEDTRDILSTYSLESRPYIGWTKECLTNPAKTPKKVLELHKNHLEIYKGSRSIMIYYFGFLISMFIITIVLFPFFNDFKNQSTFVLINFIFMMMICIVPIMRVLSSSWDYVYSQDKGFNIFEGCSDFTTNKKLTGVTDNINFAINALTILFLHVMFSISIAIYLVMFNKEENFKENY